MSQKTQLLWAFGDPIPALASHSTESAGTRGLPMPGTSQTLGQGCPEVIQELWLGQEPVVILWCPAGAWVLAILSHWSLKDMATAFRLLPEHPSAQWFPWRRLYSLAQPPQLPIPALSVKAPHLPLDPCRTNREALFLPFVFQHSGSLH